MKLLRSMLLLLLTLTVPVSGFASVTMAHCKDMQSNAAQSKAHHQMMMGDMPGMDHQHMRHGDMQKSANDSKGADHCKCGCPCKGQCSSGGCSVAAALISGPFEASHPQGAKRIGQASTSHAMAAHHLDRLRPPIAAAT